MGQVSGCSWRRECGGVDVREFVHGGIIARAFVAIKGDHDYPDSPPNGGKALRYPPTRPQEGNVGGHPHTPGEALRPSALLRDVGQRHSCLSGGESEMETGRLLRLGQPGPCARMGAARQLAAMLRFTKMHGAGNDYVYVDGHERGAGTGRRWRRRCRTGTRVWAPTASSWRYRPTAPTCVWRCSMPTAPRARCAETGYAASSPSPYIRESYLRARRPWR